MLQSERQKELEWQREGRTNLHGVMRGVHSVLRPLSVRKGMEKTKLEVELVPDSFDLRRL